MPTSIAGGRLAVRRGGREVAAWELTVVADNAPVVFWPQPPGAARGGGRVPQTRLPWQVSHEYGVTSLNAELRLRDRPDAPPLVVPIPLPGGTPRSARGVRLQDLTAHPWAGLPVTGRLVARDAPGLTGTSADEAFVLPERQFQNPVARALMEIRKQLTLKPDDRLTAGAGTRRVVGPAGGVGQRSGRVPQPARRRRIADMGLRRGWRWRRRRRGCGTWRCIWRKVRPTAPRARWTRRARPCARRWSSRSVTARPTRRRSTAAPARSRRRCRSICRRSPKRPAATRTSQQFDPGAHQLDTRDMERLAQETREAARDGKMDEAREKFAELEQMLDELNNTRTERGRMTERERQRAEQRQRGRQQMNALQDIVQRLGSLLDHAENRGDAGRGDTGGSPDRSGLRRP